MGYIRAWFENDDVLAFFTDRNGGVSADAYKSLNVSSNVGDNIRNIVQNRQIIADDNNFLLENLIYMKQVHSNHVKIIKNSFINEIKECDGIVTSKKKIPLMTMAADCAPVLLYDRVKKVIAALHSGRVGTKKEIVKNAVKLFEKEFGSNSKDIAVAIGPSIGVCCYEIGQDIVDSTDSIYIKEKNKKYYLDIKAMLKDQLLNAGIKMENIQISDICTSCNKEYFSYRRDGKCGRFCGIIMLKT